MVATLEAAPSCEITSRGEVDQFLNELRAYGRYDGKAERPVLSALVEGPRGSAKTLVVTRFLYITAEAFPGMHILVVRKTRADLASTWCLTFENEVLPPEARDAIVGDAKPDNRTDYTLPNGSKFMLVGLDRPSKRQGANLDVVLAEEVEEIQWNQIQGFYGALRKHTPGLPWQLFIGLTNPGPPAHWANQQCIAGQMRRVVTRHKDNPKFWDDVAQDWTPEGRSYMSGLSRYTGVQYKRHVLGEWAGAEGLVLDNFDEKIHVIEPPADPIKHLGIVEVRLGVDFGRAAAGCIGVWGIDARQRIICLAHAYRTGQTVDWWARLCCELVRKYHARRVICDPSGPVSTFNEWIWKEGLAPQDVPLCFGANNKRATSPGGDLGGIDLMHWGLGLDNEGVPRTRFLRAEPIGGRDAALVASHKPSSGLDEIGGWIYRRDQIGDIVGDQTDPACEDHFLDEWRYLAMDVWHVEGRYQPPPPKPLPLGSYGSICGTPETLALAQRRVDSWDEGF